MASPSMREHESDYLRTILPLPVRRGEGWGEGHSDLQFLDRLNSCESSSLASDDVNDREHDDPDHVHEMPIEAQHVRTFGMFLFDRTGDGEHHYDRQCEQPNSNVRGVQTDQRVEGCAEKVGLDGEAFVMNQTNPLTTCSDQEIRTQRNG